MLPPVHVSEDLRNAEGVLTDGETLSTFIQQSVKRSVEHRRVQAAFEARGEAGFEHYQRTSTSRSADEVAAGLQAKLDRKRTQLGG